PLSSFAPNLLVEAAFRRFSKQPFRLPRSRRLRPPSAIPICASLDVRGQIRRPAAYWQAVELTIRGEVAEDKRGASL
ncbi:hypothetical protein, partial [Methylobacterium brachythecii]